MATQEQIDLVRRHCFYPSQAELPDQIISDYIDDWLALYPEPEKYVYAMYNATLDCLRYLVYTDPNYSSGSLGSMRKEEVGQVKVTAETTGEYISRWKRILDDYLDGKLLYPGLKSVLGKGVIIGGVSQREIERVVSDPDNVDGLGCFGIDKKSARRFPSVFGKIVGPDGRWRRR